MIFISTSVLVHMKTSTLAKQELEIMKIVEKKKYLKKRVKDRAYVYQPARPKDQVIKSMVQEFVNRVFNGSAEPLLVHLVKGRHLSEKDIQTIVKLIQESE